MHPSISRFPNREFYDKQILDGPNVKQIAYKRQFLSGNMYGCYSFINVTGGMEEHDRNHSTKNLVEVAVVAEIIASLFKGSFHLLLNYIFLKLFHCYLYSNFMKN